MSTEENKNKLISGLKKKSSVVFNYDSQGRIVKPAVKPTVKKVEEIDEKELKKRLEIQEKKSERIYFNNDDIPIPVSPWSKGINVPVYTKSPDYSYFSKSVSSEDDEISSDLDIIQKSETTEKQKYNCCKCSTEVKQLSNAVITNQKNRTTKFSCDKCMVGINTCKACNVAFLEDLTKLQGYCNGCVESAPNSFVHGYNQKSERHFDQKFTPSDVKFVDTEFAGKIFKGRHHNSFVVTSNGVYATLFGIELEYETHNHGLGVLTVKDLISQFALLKKDSTLIKGFEVVSTPADKQFHSSCWREFFDRIENDPNIFCAPYVPPANPEDPAAKGTGCGCHIHVSKDAMFNQNGYGKFNAGPGLAIGKLVSFIHSPRNRKFVEVISGRESNMFSNFTTKRGIQFDKNGRITAIKDVTKLPGGFNGHRTAINFNSSNGQTIEFRMFRSTKNYDELLKNIDFVDALCTFCRTGNSSIQQMNDWIYFYEFVRRNRHDYPKLYRFFLRDEGFLTLLNERRSNTEAQNPTVEQAKELVKKIKTNGLLSGLKAVDKKIGGSVDENWMY